MERVHNHYEKRKPGKAVRDVHAYFHLYKSYLQ